MANREGFGRDQEEPKPDYPQQRRQAVQEAREELDEAPIPEDFSSYPPLETVPAERFSTGQEAASEALEDQQQRRLEQSMVDRVKSQGIRAAESVGIPLGMAMQPQQTVDMAPDPVRGFETQREAATLANQELAQNRKWIKQYMKDNPEHVWRGKKGPNPFDQIFRGSSRVSTSGDPYRRTWYEEKGRRIQKEPIDKAREPLDKARKHQDYIKDMDKRHDKIRDIHPDWNPLKKMRAEAAEGVQAAQGEFDKAKAAVHNTPAYNKWAAATARAMRGSQELQNLSAMASDLITGVSKAAGGISGGMALFGIVTGGLMVGHEVLKELGDADDTAIPKTLRFIAQNQEAPLYDYHVAPEAAAQLTPQDIEELYQDGTLSHEFYTQLKGR